MQYRAFGSLPWQASALGLGAMRLPVRGGESAQIDEDAATSILHYAIDQGINYVDTAYLYHDGSSEPFLGRALQGGYRQRVRLATKLPTWLVKEPSDFDRFLNEQLARLQTEHIDFYLLHSLHRDLWRRLDAMGVLTWAERAQADGRIGHLGFSFHDTYDAFEEILDAYSGWALSQIYYNYLCEDRQAGTRGLKLAASRGLAVVVMGPLQGGVLAKTPPAPVQAIWQSASFCRTPADWGLQWVWDHPEVSVALSGMSTLDQVVENVTSAGASGPGALDSADLAVIGRARDCFLGLRPVPCSECKYCQPCPNEIDIPEIFSDYNLAMAHDEAATARNWYQGLAAAGHGADRCAQCGECEALCPQKIEIMTWLPRIHEYFMA